MRAGWRGRGAGGGGAGWSTHARHGYPHLVIYKTTKKLLHFYSFTAFLLKINDYIQLQKIYNVLQERLFLVAVFIQLIQQLNSLYQQHFPRKKTWLRKLLITDEKDIFQFGPKCFCFCLGHLSDWQPTESRPKLKQRNGVRHKCILMDRWK